MLFWAIAIAVLSIAMVITSVVGFAPVYQISIACGTLLVSLYMMFRFIHVKRSDREEILENQLDEILKENKLLNDRI